MTFAGFEILPSVLILGMIVGMTYGILAVGLTLIFRSSRIINFAHGEMGALPAALLGLVVTRWGVPYWIAFLLALALAAAVGGLSEVMVVRRLRKAPPLMSIVATLGLGQFLLMFSMVVNAEVATGQTFPQPALLPDFDIGALRVTPAFSGMLLLTPLLVVGLVAFLRRSRYGLAIRASADDRATARLAGIRATRMSTLAWSIGGSLSAFTAILVLPTRGFTSAEFLGPGLLLRALAAAVVARMVSLPVALAAGVAVGVTEQLLLWNHPRSGLVEAALFLVILVGLLVQSPKRGGRSEEKGSWAAVLPWPPLPEALTAVWSIRNLGTILAAGMLIVGLLLPLVVTNATAIILVTIMAFALVGVSLGLVTGLAGQLTLGQFALAGVGATASAWITTSTGNFPLAFLVAGLAAAAASLVVGLPALRIRGLMLAVTTLGFALAAQSWFLEQPWMLGDGINPGRPIFGSFVADTGKKYYLFALVFLVFGLWLARNVWRGGLGLQARALRDNEDGAQAFTIPPTLTKLRIFALAGFVAGVGGAVYGHALTRLTSSAFPVGASIDVAAMTVLGGIGILAGPLIGALYIIGVPTFVPLDSAGLAASALGWLILVLYFPGGIAQLVRPLRDRAVDLLARRAGLDPAEARDETADAPDAPGVSTAPLVRPTERRPVPGQEPLLRVEDLAKSYGGVHAVQGVSLEVRAGETVGLIGPNGAGKTTLLELISGFTRPDDGLLLFSGREITRLTAAQRGRLGLIRSFQDAQLFGTLTVVETVRLALERSSPTSFLRTVLGSHADERRKEARARELVRTMGLHRYRHTPIDQLSTGTRRITELTCMIALEPTLLLLDEPSAGIAQRETEALGQLLVRLKEELGLTLVVVEHDMPLVMGMSDRIVAMESGRVIADDRPAVVQEDVRVVESYLGGDREAIARSGILAPSADGRCQELTRQGSPCSRPADSDGVCWQHRRTGRTVR